MSRRYSSVWRRYLHGEYSRNIQVDRLDISSSLDRCSGDERYLGNLMTLSGRSLGHRYCIYSRLTSW